MYTKSISSFKSESEVAKGGFFCCLKNKILKVRSIERRFNMFLEKNPLWSSLICLSEAIRNQNFSRKSINFWFKKLVEKDDYCKEDKKDIISSLEKL